MSLLGKAGRQAALKHTPGGGKSCSTSIQAVPTSTPSRSAPRGKERWCGGKSTAGEESGGLWQSQAGHKGRAKEKRLGPQHKGWGQASSGAGPAGEATEALPGTVSRVTVHAEESA